MQSPENLSPPTKETADHISCSPPGLPLLSPLSKGEGEAGGGEGGSLESCHPLPSIISPASRGWLSTVSPAEYSGIGVSRGLPVRTALSSHREPPGRTPPRWWKRRTPSLNSLPSTTPPPHKEPFISPRSQLPFVR